MITRGAALGIVALACSLLSCHPRRAGRDPVGPRAVLYAWDRPEQMDALDPARAQVAFFAGKVMLTGDEVRYEPRHTPLSIAPGVRAISVVHIESDHYRRPLLTDDQRRRLVAILVDAAKRFGASELQIDYEARVSERAFFRALMIEVRSALGSDFRISMTALASWCLFDGWIAGLPVDEAVPMLYRMGADRDVIRSQLDAGRDFRVSLCRHSLAISTADPPPRLPSGRRVFAFNPVSFTPEEQIEIISNILEMP